MSERTNLTTYASIAGVFEMPEAGWFLRLHGSYPVSVGMDKPPTAFRTGARVKLSVELANEAPATVDHAATIRRNQVVPVPRG